MKFLHTLPEVFLDIMHKKWNMYLYLESDTKSGNFEAGITKFIVTRHPLEFTHCTEMRFLWHASENQLLLLLPVMQFCVMPCTKSYITFSAVHCSAFLHSFPGLALASHCTQAT